MLDVNAEFQLGSKEQNGVGNWAGSQFKVKRSAGVALEVNLKKIFDMCTNKAAQSDFETQRRRRHTSKKGDINCPKIQQFPPQQQI